MSEKRQLQKAQTRERIVTAAMKVYSKDGFSAPTAVIAEEAQVSHGSVFVHFPSVEDLLTTSLENFSNEIKNELDFLSNYRNDIVKLLEMHTDVLIRHEEFYKRLIKETVYLPEEAKNTFIAIQSMVSIHFLQALEKEMSEGKIKDLPFHMIFNTWLGLIHYYLMNSDLFAPQGSVLELYKESLIGSFLTLIRK
jgi:AcrR family transcriptional regulator